MLHPAYKPPPPPLRFVLRLRLQKGGGGGGEVGVFAGHYGTFTTDIFNFPRLRQPYMPSHWLTLIQLENPHRK